LIRRRMDESPLFAELKREGRTSTNPLRDSFAQPENRRLVLIALFGATMGQGVVWYTGQFYSMAFMGAKGALHLAPGLPERIVLVACLLGTPLFVVFGALSDRIGRKKLMMAGCLLAAICYIPIYHGMAAAAGWDPENPKRVIESVNFPVMVALVWIQVVFVAMVYGPIAAFLVELFPTRIRYTSMSLPYHIGNGVFGGFVPYVSTWLGTKFGLTTGLIYPVTIAAVCFVVGMFFLPDRAPEHAAA
jgi:MFS family permease